MPTVIVYWSPGRTPEQKKAVIEGVTEVMVAQGGARKQDVLVIFQNIEPGDAGRGGELVGQPAWLQKDDVYNDSDGQHRQDTSGQPAVPAD